MKILRRTQFGNPVLRSVARELTNEEIVSENVQKLVKNMYYTLDKKRYGVGLAAPQIGEAIALAVLSTKPTPTRPDLKVETLTLFNPEIIKSYGPKKGMWEACISGSELYGKALRYSKIRVKWQDETAKHREQDFESIMAHVLQHEIDHLNGVLFVDRVKDPKTYITFSEYNKRRKQKLL